MHADHPGRGGETAQAITGIITGGWPAVEVEAGKAAIGMLIARVIKNPLNPPPFPGLTPCVLPVH